MLTTAFASPATHYTADKVRSLFPNAAELRKRWADAGGRSEIIAALADRGIDFDELAEAANQPDADPFDLLCHLTGWPRPRKRRSVGAARWSAP